MSASAFDHPVLSALLGDEDMDSLLGHEAELKAMILFETALAESEAEHGMIPAAAARTIAAALSGFEPDLARLREGAARDGVVVPELVRQMRQAVGDQHSQHLHFGATSQDVVDTALVMRIAAALPIIDTRLERLAGMLGQLIARFGGRRLVGRTRMQPAIDITVADRLESWRAPLDRHRERLTAISPLLLAVQFGGAAGTLEKLSDLGPAVRRGLAQRLGLADAPQWHSQRDRIAELGSWLASLTGSLGKLGQDVALMAAASGEIVLSGGGESSAMPHKQNPVAAEILVALARFNAVQISGLQQAMVHENERSGAAWTLEWLLLPEMLMAAAAATRTAERLLQNIESLGTETA